MYECMYVHFKGHMYVCIFISLYIAFNSQLIARM